MKNKYYITSNPSRIATLVGYYNRGLLTESELNRLKREALSINVYKGKGKVKDENSTVGYHNYRFEK